MKTVGGKRRTAARRAVTDCSCALALAILMTSPANAARQSDLTISVRVYNYAKVSRRVLDGAEREAGRVLSAAGIDTRWVDCLAPQDQAQSGPESAEPAKEANSDCGTPERGATVGLRIINASTGRSKNFSDEMFGFATGSDLATVFYQRVEDLAWGADKDGNETHLILGDVIAHEFGHLLLGTNSHSPAGIMCANWDREYLLLALRGHGLFSPEQSALIRAAVRHRNAEIVQPKSKLDGPLARLTLTTRVENYAAVEPGKMRRAEREASRIIGRAGIDIVWWDCTASRFSSLPGQGIDKQECDREAVGTIVDLRILNSSNYHSAALNWEVFGFADGPCLASVEYDRLARLAEADGDLNEAELLLGHVMAHEIGHLLLGPDAHSPIGIMVGWWDRAQLQRALTGRQWFTPDQSARIRAAMEARTKL